MLAGCSSSLVSPRHRLKSEASAQFQACHFQLPSMSTQNLNLPCTFPRKDASRSQPIRPVGLSVEKSIEAKPSSCSLKQSIRLPPSATNAQPTFLEGGGPESKDDFWGRGKRSLKRFAEQGSEDEQCLSRVKRKRGICTIETSDDSLESDHCLSLGHLGSGNLWIHPGFEVPRSVPGITNLNTAQVPIFSGEEEKVSFVPSDLISPPLPLSNSPWNSVEITELGDKDVKTSQGPPKEASRSSTASDESHSLGHSLNENSSAREAGNGSSVPFQHEGISVVAAAGNEDNQGDHQDFELISLLLACVEAISSKNIAATNHYIARLGDRASPRGGPIYRIAAYFTEALALRVARVWPHIFHLTPPRELDRADDDSGSPVRLLNQATAIPKFIHFTSNEILLRAFEGKDKVHIIDFDIKQGLQWPSLLQTLASRAHPPAHVRITGIGESKQELNETGDRLSGFAEALDLPFEFHPVVDRLEDVRLWMLHVKEKESVAINCAFQLHKVLYDGSGVALRDLLGLIRSTNPSIVVVAEQEAEHNEPSLEARVCNSLRYYAGIFDLVDSSLPLGSPSRTKIEELFAREIRNIIACEGSDRFERHVGYDKWRRSLEQHGFGSVGVSEREFLQSQMLLKMYSSNNYRVEKQEQGGAAPAALTLSWQDQPLYTISAWAPIDIAGSSSSFSRPG